MRSQDHNEIDSQKNKALAQKFGHFKVSAVNSRIFTNRKQDGGEGSQSTTPAERYYYYYRTRSQFLNP
jgi:hypothetical protein